MDAVVSAPPFTVRWDPVSDHRFEGYAVPPRSVADYAFLLHGLHYLKEDGVMVILLHPGALWRGGAETIVRRRLLENDYVDAVISLPGGLFYTTGCPACIIVLKKRRKASGVLFIEGPATEGKGHRWHLTCNQVNFILRTYRDRSSVRASLEEIAGEGLYSLSPAKFGTLVPRPSHEPKIG
jgi:type I restriction enzyme M protein